MVGIAMIVGKSWKFQVKRLNRQGAKDAGGRENEGWKDVNSTWLFF
jgi:hypothetical protein